MGGRHAGPPVPEPQNSLPDVSAPVPASAHLGWVAGDEAPVGADLPGEAALLAAPEVDAAPVEGAAPEVDAASERSATHKVGTAPEGPAVWAADESAADLVPELAAEPTPEPVPEPVPATRPQSEDQVEARPAAKPATKQVTQGFWTRLRNRRRRLKAERAAEEAPQGPPPSPEAVALAKSTRRIILWVLSAITVGATAMATVWVVRGVWNPRWGTERAGTVCPVELMDPAAPEDTKVNVYNSSNAEGRAARTADKLRERGFQVGTVTNGSLDQVARSGVGLILTGPDTLGQALALQRQINGIRVALQPERGDGTVDLLLGEDFNGLVSAGRVNPAPGHLACVRQNF